MKKIFAAITTVLLLTSMYIAFIKPVKAEARSDLDVTFYASDTAAWTAMLAGSADFMQWALTKEQKEAAEANPNIQLCRVDENGMYEFDINNNYSIATYPGMRSATNALRVRQAIARLVDKDFIIATILLYYGVRIDQPMAATQMTGWANASCIGINYPYPYNPQEAANLLAAEGFADTDANGWLNYPSGWPGVPERADTTAYPLVVCVRSDHAHRLAAGQYLISQLEVTLAGTTIGAGFKTTGVQWQQPRAVLSPKVMGNRDFNVYTGGWSVGRYPTYLFSLYHSQFWFPYGPSYNVGFDNDGTPMYEDVDTAVDDIWYTDSIANAKLASQYFCYLHSKVHCINVPLWSYSSYWAYAKTLVGVVNEDGYGIENAYTFLNAYRVGGGPIRIATISGPDRLNILHSQWYFEYAFLDRVYTGGMSVSPYDLATDQPWVIQDWETGTWDDAGTTKSMVTYYLRKDAAWVTPVTGCTVRPFDAHDFEFTVWYNYAFADSWQFASFMDVKYTKILDLNGDGWDEYQVFFDDNSYWFYSAPTYPLLPKQELLNLLCDTTIESWAQTGTGVHLLANNVVQVVTCTLDGTTTLVEGVDYRLDAGYDLASHIEFYPLRDLTGTISITYWYADIPSTGFYLAGLPWQTTMYALGHHYPVSMTNDPPGIGDTIVLAKNPCFFMDLPLLGEIDWAWKWQGSVKPRSGFYKIEIFDVVRATGAYCTRGDGTFNPKFFPGADIDQTDLCHIGIFDLVSITGKYGKTFATPPYSYHYKYLPLGATTITLTPLADLVGASAMWTTSTYNMGPIIWNSGAPGSASDSLTVPALHVGWAYGYYITSAGKLEKVQLQIDP
jgi:ABC-type oligopeptide transport system substrate-binding subunit